ncbi:MAG: McrC family protein [Fimbriiglobus sp.]|nr:McrC family protein [Fimbriiglobus sp.]
MNFSLTERRTVVRALPRAVAAELAERFSHAVEVAPTFDRRRYKLTARGYVGWVRVGGHTITFRPKRPWHEVRCLFGGSGNAVTGCDATRPVAASPVPQPDLLSLLATRLAALMLDRAAAGLARGYVEREITAGTLRGRIDLARQLRQPTLQPTLFDQIADEWTPDIPCNRIPKATALRLLAEPGLSGEAREALTRAVAAFAEVSDSPASVSGPPPEPYRELLDWCDLIGTENVLVSLERAFEGYVTRAFREALGEAVRPQRWIELQPDTLAVGSRLTLTPDLTVLRDSIPVCVWDAKWKRPEPTSSDVHQALAYAAVLGVPACGLVYPGRRWKLETLTAPSGVTLQLLRLPLTDDSVPWRRAVRRIVNLP